MVVAKLLFHQPQDGMIPLSSAIAQDLGDQFSRRIKGENVDRHSLGSHLLTSGERQEAQEWHHLLQYLRRALLLRLEQRPLPRKSGSCIRWLVWGLNVTFRKDGNCIHFMEILREEFPQFRPDNGFWLLRAAIGGNGVHQLQVIPPSPVGYTPSYLRNVGIQQQTTLYFRPLQDYQPP